MSFVRFINKGANEITLNTDFIVGFTPNETGGTVISLSDKSVVVVSETNRKVRNLIADSLAGKSESSED